jgi:hypothetical protein
MSQHPPFVPTVPTDPAQELDARFAPPTAHVEPIAPLQVAGEPIWFSVSPLKLVVMCTVTLQFYSVYWFYKQWKLVRDREHSSILPAMRAIFPIFFIWSLGTKVRDAEVGPGPRLNAGGMAAAWIVCSLMWKAPGAMWWIAMAAPLFLIPLQNAMNATNRAITPGHPENDRFTWVNWIGIVLGAGFVGMALLGTYIEMNQG